MERVHPDTPNVLGGTDFFTVEVLTWSGLVTYYVLFFIHLGSRRVSIAGITEHPDSFWMEQIARNATLEELGHLRGCRYLLHDRDTKFCQSFREIIKAAGAKPLKLPARSPNLNAFSERWVRSVKEECLSRLILFGESAPDEGGNEFRPALSSGRRIIKAKQMFCCFQRLSNGWVLAMAESAARSDWAAC